MNVIPVQASTLSQSSTVTVTGGHYYTYTYYQEVQTGTQQVQTGTTTETVVTGTGTCSTVTPIPPNIGFLDNCPSGVSLTETDQYTFSENIFTDYNWTRYGTETVPVYTAEPVYTNEQFTGTAWSPATITYS